MAAITHWPHDPESNGWLAKLPAIAHHQNVRFAQVRSSKIKQMFMSGWSKFENRFFHAVPSIQNAEDLGTDVTRGD